MNMFEAVRVNVTARVVKLYFREIQVSMYVTEKGCL